MTDYATGHISQDTSYDNLNVIHTLGQCETKIRAQCVVANTINTRRINILEGDDPVPLDVTVQTTIPLEGDGSDTQPIAFNPPYLVGLNSTPECVNPIPINDHWVDTTNFSILTNNQIVDETQTVQLGQFRVTLDGVYKLFWAADIVSPNPINPPTPCTGGPPLAGITTRVSTGALLNTGANLQGQESHTFTNSTEYVSRIDHLEVISNIRLNANDTVRVGFDQSTINTLPLTNVAINLENQQFGIVWVSA
jgi:hypothetical protein